MAVSALSGVFREYTLTYEVASGTSTDGDGNPIETTTTAELVINFEPYAFNMVRFMPGADPLLVRGKGSCVNPSTMPSQVKPGTELDMTYSGRVGKLRILQISDDALEVLDEVLGQEFLAEWRFTGA